MENLRGIVLMVASMAGFAIEDMFIKWAAADVPTGQILLLLSVFGTPVFAALAWRQGASFWASTALHPAVIWRNAGEMVGTAGFVTALALTPLTSATAIFQATPLAVTLGAAVFLGETVGWRRWTAILVGFCGVILIIRPGMDGFSINSLWSVLAVIGLSARDVATRRIPKTISTMSGLRPDRRATSLAHSPLASPPTGPSSKPPVWARCRSSRPSAIPASSSR
jgi:drug/metabolite transporter (DMT)-like permease